MHSVLVLVLISVLQLSISFPAVAGDCYDDPPNNSSYDNCNTCYQTLANALINTKDNKYHLGQAFFPDDSVTPVQVTVEYLCMSATDTEYTNCTTINSDTNCTDTTWYWLRGEFFVYQPLDIFLYRSLLFSPPHWRKKSVQLYLPHQCFICSNNSDAFFGHLTQRLRLYASSQSATAEVSRTYVGKAINASHAKLGDDAVYGDGGQQIIPVVYAVPFGMVFLFFILLITLSVYKCKGECTGTQGENETQGENGTQSENETQGENNMQSNKVKIKQDWKKAMSNLKNIVTNDLQVQANLAAVTFLCGIFTIYAFALDMISVRKENSANLPQYYHRKSYGFYYITIAFNSVSLFCDIIGILWLFVAFLHNFCSKKKWEVYIPILFCIGSALLSLSFHFQNILIAWSTDPFYASRIALFYGIIIFCYFVCVKYAYTFPLKILRRNEDSKNYWDRCELIFVAISLIVAIVVCSGIIAAVAMFIIYVPINNSIEESVTGVSTIFNGAVVLIGGFIAYRVSIQYFGRPFSLEDALKNAMNEIEKTPFKPKNPDENKKNPDDNKKKPKKWSELNEEERITEVIKALIHRETSKGPPYPDSSSHTSNQEPS